MCVRVGGRELAAELRHTRRDRVAREIDVPDRVAVGPEALGRSHEAIRRR